MGVFEFDSEDKKTTKQISEKNLRVPNHKQTVNMYLKSFNPNEDGVVNIKKKINLRSDGFDLIWKIYYKPSP
jgi:hypothetical protein